MTFQVYNLHIRGALQQMLNLEVVIYLLLYKSSLLCQSITSKLISFIAKIMQHILNLSTRHENCLSTIQGPFYYNLPFTRILRHNLFLVSLY